MRSEKGKRERRDKDESEVVVVVNKPRRRSVNGNQREKSHAQSNMQRKSAHAPNYSACWWKTRRSCENDAFLLGGGGCCERSDELAG